MDTDRKEQLRALARQRIQSLLAGPKLTALSPGDEKAEAKPAPVTTAALRVVPSPKDDGWDLPLLRSSVEEILDGGDVWVPTEEAAAPLVQTALEMGEATLAQVIGRMRRIGCGSLHEFGGALADGNADAAPWDWPFLVTHMQVGKLGPGVRVRAEHDLDDIAAILNEHDEVVFTSEGRLRDAVERARQERFESLEHLFADMLAARVLCIAGLKIVAGIPDFPGLRFRSTAEFLVSVSPKVGTVEELLADGRWQSESLPAARSQKPRKVGYVYVMSDPGTGGLLKIGQTMHHPQVRLHQLNKDTSRVYPLELVEFWECDNPAAVERELHEALAHCRVTQYREFFATDVETVRRAAKRILG